jgi:hypothetical protein
MILHEMHGDSVTIVKVIKHNGDANDEEVILHSNKITLRHAGDSQSSKILFVIDGVSHPEKKGLDAVDPDQIDRIEVVKGDGIKLYTTENYDGVIIITTKTAKKK